MFDFSIVTNWIHELLLSVMPEGLAIFIECVAVGVCLVALYAILAIILIYMERKVCGFFQCRLGPNRVGKWGSIQVVCDVLKMLTKEIFMPKGADHFLYNLAPFMVIIASFLTFACIPFNKGAAILNFNVGVFFLLAASSIGVVGILLAGWGSNNKFSLIGAMRSGAQIISYELSVGMSIMTMVVLMGTMQFSEIVEGQANGWFIFKGHIPAVIAFIIYLIAGNAECNRGPFDLPEAESELTAGYHTEYSGMGFGFFYLAEYLNLFILGGGSGIYSNGSVTISGGTVNANGGDGQDGYGGDGIRSSSGGVTISGGTVTANGGNSTNSSGGYGISSLDVAISSGTVTANGGDSKDGYGGDGIHSNDIDLSGSLELTAKAGKGTQSNGKALSQNGRELDLNAIKDKLGPGAKVTATDADGKVIDQVSIPRPVEPEGPVIPEESSSSSDGGSAAPSAPAFSLPGLTVTDKDGQRISYTSTQSGNTLTVCVGRFTASFRISLAALRQLRAEGIETITFQTILCSTTLSVDELLAMGGEDAEAVLTHRSTDSSLTVG